MGVWPAAIAQQTGEIDPAFRADIVRMLHLTVSDQMSETVFQQVKATLQPLMPEAGDDFWDQMKAEIDTDVLNDRLVPVYAEHLTHEDVLGVVAFYESPAGRRYLAAYPQIFTESMQVASQWSHEVYERVERRIEQAQQNQE
jgi:hypothetical protein